MIKTTNLRKVYRIGTEKIVALDNINLEVEEGTVCCILGTSGSGKSTLLNQLAGLEKPTRGEVAVRGRRISKMTEKELALFRQQSIGFVFQSYNLLPGMTAIENVALPLTFRGMRRRERLRLAERMLTQVGLGDRKKHNPNEMSGGQQQRVGIARAFVTNPAVVFADEPTGNLDTHTTKEIMTLFLDFSRQKGTTIILVTHDASLANYADRIVTIVDGRVVDDKPNQSLYDAERRQADAEKAWEEDRMPPEGLALLGPGGAEGPGAPPAGEESQAADPPFHTAEEATKQPSMGGQSK